MGMHMVYVQGMFEQQRTRRPVPIQPVALVTAYHTLLTHANTVSLI